MCEPRESVYESATVRLFSHVWKRALRETLETLKKNGVELADAGDEIGPTSPGSPHMSLWLHDPDGYRWELSVLNGDRQR